MLILEVYRLDGDNIDMATKPNLVVEWKYGRVVVDGKLECHFLGLRYLADGQAVTLEQSLLDFLHDNGLDFTNIPTSHLSKL